MNIYKRNGFKDRKEYLKSVAEDYGMDFIVVLELATVLSPEGDFDGLISELESLE